MNHPRRSLVVLLVSSIALGACMTNSEGEALRKDLEALKSQLNKAQLQAEKGRQQLQKVLEKATGMLNRNNADVGAQVERLENNLRKISGPVEANSKALTDLSKKFADFQAKVDVKLERLTSGAPTQKQAPVPVDKDKLFALAQAQISGGKSAEGRRLLLHFLSRFATDARVPQVYLMLGDTYYKEGQFAKAILEYKAIFEQHKRSAAYPSALYKIGMSFYQLKFCSDARGFFGELEKRYRRDRNVANARKVLKLIRRFRTNRRFCTS